MKHKLLLSVFLLCGIFSYAQKKDSVGVNTNLKIKQVDEKLVKAKIVQTQSTLKQIETKLKEVSRLMDELKKQKDALSELGQQDMLMLQQMMEKKSQLETMISNCMKAYSETQNKLAAALKAS